MINIDQFASTITHSSHNTNRFTRFHSKKQQKPSKIVGGYRIGGSLGEGSNGLVCAAYRMDESNRKLAVKILPKVGDHDERVQNQVRILSAIKHENIVKIQEVIQQQNRLFIFMELCPKGDLFYHIKKNGKLPQKQASAIFLKILSSLQYLHSLGITHRDIKAQNILLDHDMNPKLSDFGLARFYDRNSPLLDTWCGSFNYIAPEIIRKRRYKGELTDLWSLGVLLYVMLAGKEPFNRDNGQDRALTKEYIVSYDWDRDVDVSKEVLELFDLVFAPAQHRISLAEVKNTSFYKKYSKQHDKNEVSPNKNSQTLITQAFEPSNPHNFPTQSPKQPIQNLSTFLGDKELSKMTNESDTFFQQFSSQVLRNNLQPRNKIQLIKMLRNQKHNRSVEPSNKFRVRKSLPKKVQCVFEF